MLCSSHIQNESQADWEHETQEHLYNDCLSLTKSLKQKDKGMPYNAIFSRSVKKQSEVTERFVNLLEVRSDILKSD